MTSFVATTLFGGSIKKYVAIVLVTVAFVLILPMMAVFAMGNETVAFLASSASAESAEQQGFYMGGPIPGNTYAWGNCTYWVFAQRLWAGRDIPKFWGNANMWDENAIRDGYEVNHYPEIGAILQTDEGQWGHVAYVTAVDPVTEVWTISEMNAPRLNVISTRTFSSSAAQYYDFIHDKKGTAI